MMFPLYSLGEFGREAGMVLGVLCGIAFGFVLERAGFGRASNLAAQFYGGDNRVLKVMFTGIATTATLLGLLSAVGLLDMSQVTVPETFVGPQIVGGLMLGVGFVVAGYCPGTGVVAAASGSIDGMLAYGGVMLGSLVFGLGWPQIEGFYNSGGMGSVRLDQLVGLPFSVVAFAVVGMAVGAFFGAEKLEAWLAARRGTEAPDRAPWLRNVSLGVVAAVATVALVPAMMPRAEATAPVPEAGSIDAESLAGRIVAGQRDLWILDTRAGCATATVPGAVCAADAEGLSPTRTLVVVKDAGQAVPAFAGRVLVLDGGFEAFRSTVLTAPSLPAEPTVAQIAAYQRRGALHGYFTGTAAPAAAPVVVKKAAAGPAAKKGGGC